MSMHDAIVISEHDLKDWQHSGGRIRSICPLHKGQTRTLSLNPWYEGMSKEDARIAGVGHCHNANCEGNNRPVLVKEWNARAANRLLQEPICERRPKIHVTPDEVQQADKWQLTEVQVFNRLYETIQQGLAHPRAQVYLQERGLGDMQALLTALGLGYIPPASEWKCSPALVLRRLGIAEEHSKLLDKWCDRIIFPYETSQGGRGFLGRSLYLWRSGMDENAHKDALDAWNEQAIGRAVRRWEKTYRSGFFPAHTLSHHKHVYLVEGPFDALPFHHIGLSNVVAVAGTAIDVAAIPKNVLSVTIAFDADIAGSKKTAKLEEDLGRAGISYDFQWTPKDGQGKDWSERYRRAGRSGLQALLSPVTADPEEIPGSCSCCGAEVEFYDDQGVPYCAIHWPASGKVATPFCTPLDETSEGPVTVITANIPAFLRAYTARLQPGARIALDLETTGLDRYRHKIVTVQLGMPGAAYILDVRAFYGLPVEQKQAWSTAFQHLFRAESVTWIGHNLKFDWLFLVEHFGVAPGCTYDTMIAEQCLHMGQNVKLGMKETADRYHLEVSKDEQLSTVDLDKGPGWNEPFSPALVAYMAQDVAIPHKFYELQQPLLQGAELERVVNLENAAMLAVISMETRGALVDRDQLARITAIKQQKQAALEQALLPILASAYERVMVRRSQRQTDLWEAYEEARKAQEKEWIKEYQAGAGAMRFNQFLAQKSKAYEEEYPKPAKPKQAGAFKLSSSPDLLIALAELGIEARDTQAETLEAIAGKHSLLPDLLTWKRLQTSLNTFCSKLGGHVQRDGRIHADFHTVSSGRYVTSSPNLQALPKQRDGESEEEDPRRCIVAAPGYVLVGADLSNIELRILAEVAHDETMLGLFAEGKDLHAETAKLMFGLPEDTNTKTYLIHGKVARDIAKTINFGLAYGMGAQGLANRTGVSLETAKELMRRYFATYRGVDAYLKQSGRAALQRGYAVSLSGRRRFFPKIEDPRNTPLVGRYERSAKNHPIQGTNADILKRALALLHTRLPEEVYIVLTVHDEIILEALEARAEIAETILQDTLVEACRDFLKEVTIPTPKVTRGGYWQKD